MSLIQANNLSISIADRLIFSNLELRLNPGECWGILGANGAGKTTLLHGLAGLKQLQAGEVYIEGKNISDYSRKNIAKLIGILLQDSADGFPITVLEAVLSGRYPHLGLISLDTAEDISICREALAQVSLHEMAERPVHTLSGGERRRLALATLIAQQPKIWLLDEPTNHLDLHYQISMLELIINKVKVMSGGMIMVLHDVNLLTRFCSHALLMINAEIQISGEIADVITTDNLQALYQHPVRSIKEGESSFYFPA